MTPFFSVIIVHHESVRRDYVYRCLTSLYAQEFRNFEIILIHDGPRQSRWETEDVPPPKDIKVKTLCTDRRHNDWGHSLRDLGMKMASGHYIINTNADNVHYANCLMSIFIETQIDRQPIRMEIEGRSIIVNEPDIVIYPVFMMGYVPLGNSFIRIKDADLQTCIGNKLFLSGFPVVRTNIDCMQFVMRRDLWEKEGWWSVKTEESDGIMYEKFARKYGTRYLSAPLGEHW
jgi:hypothetical protein